MRRALAAGLVLVTLAIVAGAIAFWYVSSGRFGTWIRARIVAQIEEATGGRAEIGRFVLDWRTLTVEIDHTIIHGTEPAGALPLLSVEHIVARFRIVSAFSRKLDLASVRVDRPNTHLIVAPDGGTNLPRPRSRNRSGIQQILDLAIGAFDVSDGVVIAESAGGSTSRPWNASGRNLQARFNYDANGARYTGSLAISPVRITTADFGSIDVESHAEVELDRDRLRVSAANLRAGQSEISLSNLEVRNFAAPVITSHYDARIFPRDFSSESGKIESNGDVRFVSLNQYSVNGTMRGEDIDLGQFRHASLAAAFDAQPERVSLTGIRAHVSEGEVTGSAEVRNFREFRMNGRLERFEARPLIALAAHQNIPYSARLSGPFDASGDLRELRRGRLLASANLTATPDACAGCIAVNGNIHAKFNGNAGTLELGPSSIALPSTQIDVSGVVGRELTVRAETRDLEDLRPAIGPLHYVRLRGGDITFAGVVTGSLSEPAIAGRVTVRHATINTQQVDAFSGGVAIRRNLAAIKDGLLTEGSLKARISGSIALADWHPTDKSAIDARAQVSGADVKTLLAMAGEKEIDFTGSGSAEAQVTGTPAEPHVNASLGLIQGSIYSQPYDRLSGHLAWPGTGAQLFDLTFISGPKRVLANGHFDHPAGAAPLTGTISFHSESNTMALNQIALVRARQPDLHGAAQFRADGSAKVSRDDKGDLHFDLLGLNGDGSLSKIELAGRDLGDARVTASTTQNVLTVRLDSNAAKASIHGNATVQLEGDDPLNVAVTFSRAGFNALAMLLAKPEQARYLNFDGTAAGELSLRGPAREWTRMRGTLSIPEFELFPLGAENCGTESACAGMRNFRLRNSGSVELGIANGAITVDSARFTGPQTDITITGTVGLTERGGYNLRAVGDLNLALGSTFSTDFITSGSLHLNAAIRGALRSPDLSGSIEVRNASARYTGFSNGLSNVNAALVFNGDRATIQNFSAESGGGQVGIGGFIALTEGLLAFRLQVRTTGVRLRFAEGASIVSDSTITVAGTSERSEASGSVIIHRVSINPRADLSSIFARAAEPVKTATLQAGLLSKLNLDVQIETAPDVALETSVAQRIQADANLRLRGTATNPALLGRVNITSGELMFFGNKYTITQGSVSFLNPARIDPVVNVDLETRARGVDVILTIAGPLTKPGVSYRSDPPLQFSDIVALLATGRSPFDPGLPTGAVGQQQAFAQLGASQLIGEAIANPASGRLQRFFGVTRAKIDPQLTEVTGSPESRLTIEQQVSPDILFTYITDVSNTSTQLIRVEWAFNRNWSAIVTREENGYVGLDFAYRKRFK